jgi:hypothetical protein
VDAQHQPDQPPTRGTEVICIRRKQPGVIGKTVSAAAPHVALSAHHDERTNPPPVRAARLYDMACRQELQYTRAPAMAQ